MRERGLGVDCRAPPSEKLSGVRLTIPMTLGIGSSARQDLSSSCFPRGKRSLAHDVIPAISALGTRLARTSAAPVIEHRCR